MRRARFLRNSSSKQCGQKSSIRSRRQVRAGVPRRVLINDALFTLRGVGRALVESGSIVIEKIFLAGQSLPASVSALEEGEISAPPLQVAISNYVAATNS